MRRAFLAFVVFAACLASALALTPGQQLLLFGGVQPTVFANLLGGSLPSWLSYSGASLRTITDATGAITYAPNSLAPYSVMQSGWTAVNSSIAGNIITDNVTNAAHAAYGPNWNYTAGVNYLTVGTFTAPATGWIAFNPGWANGITWFNLSGAGSVGTKQATVQSAGIQKLADDSYQVWSKASNNITSSTNVSVYIAPSDNAINYSGAGASTTVVATSASAVTYETTPRPGDQVITQAAAYYGPAFDYDPVSHAPQGLRIEEARTNLFLNSGAPATQTITVANASAYTISFYGTGIVTLSGALTQVMTGSVYPARTTYTGTTATTSLVVTVTSLLTMTYPQVELGAFATSAIPTAAASVTRAADVVTLQGAALAVFGGASGGPVAVSAIFEMGPTPNYAAAGYILKGFGNDGLGSNSSPTGQSLYNGSNLVASGTNQSLSNSRVGFSANNAGRSLVMTGGSVVSDLHPNGVNGSTMYLGSANGIRAWDGYVRKLAIYNRTLTAQQLQSRTVLGAPF